MPFEITIDTEARLLTARVRGHFAGPEVIELSDRVREHPQNQDGLRHLYDFSEADVTTVVPADVRSIAARDPKHEVVCYSVIATEDLAFGLSRLFEAIAQNREDRVAVFRSECEARAWIEERFPVD